MFEYKKLPVLLWLLCWSLLWISKIQAADFAVQDRGLQKCVNELASSKHWSQADDFVEIECHSEGVKSLIGLEQFTNLQTLSLYNNKLEAIDIDLSVLPNLKTLNLARNQLVQVAIENLANIETLFLFANRIENLALNDLPKLDTLKTNNNAIEKFHYANTPQLKKIYIFNNELETINIYDLPALQYMDCRENPMPDELYDEMDKMESVTFLHDGNAEDW